MGKIDEILARCALDLARQQIGDSLDCLSTKAYHEVMDAISNRYKEILKDLLMTLVASGLVAIP